MGVSYGISGDSDGVRMYEGLGTHAQHGMLLLARIVPPAPNALPGPKLGGQTPIRFWAPWRDTQPAQHVEEWLLGNLIPGIGDFRNANGGQSPNALYLHSHASPCSPCSTLIAGARTHADVVAALNPTGGAANQFTRARVSFIEYYITPTYPHGYATVPLASAAMQPTRVAGFRIRYMGGDLSGQNKAWV